MDIKKVNGANALATGSVSKEELDKEIEVVAKKYSKNMKLDGFRKGKIPTHMIKARYKDQLDKDAKQSCVDRFYANALKELGLDSSTAIGSPLAKFNQDNEDLLVELKIGIKPEFDLDGLEACVPSFELPEVRDDEIETRLNEYAQRKAALIESSQEELKSGLVGNINFEGFLDGVAFQDGKGEKFDLMIGSNQFIPGFEDALIGMKKDEERTISVTFPQDYQAQNLAGKECTFQVKLNEIKEKEKIEINDNFAKSVLGEGEENTLEKLKEHIKLELQREKKNNLYNDGLKEKLLESISKNINFDLPENIVEQEMNILFRNELSSAAPEELKELQESADKSREKFESFRERAEISVKVTFIVDKFAKDKKIEASDNEVFQTLYYEAMMSGQNPKELIENYKNNNLLPAIKMAMIEDKVLSYLLDNSKKESKAN